MWSFSMPHLQSCLEDGQGDRRQEDGGSSLIEEQRDGRVLVHAAAAFGVRQLQELRGPLASGLHGRERCGDAWEGGRLRAQGGSLCWWQEEVRWSLRALTVWAKGT